MAVLWEIDPTSEDAGNTPLSLVGVVSSVNYRLVEMDLTPPDIAPMYATSADTEGDPFVDSRFRNRIISLGFVATSTTDALLQTGIQSLQQKLDKLRREGGTLKMTTQAGTTAVGDVNYVTFKPVFEPALYSTNNHGLRFTLDFECKPLFRGTAVQLADHAETTLPACIGVDTSVGGDVAALVRILIDEDQAANQYWVVWGIQSRYYDSATSAALFYEAEGRTLLGSSAIVTQTGASGGGASNAIEATLETDYLAVLSTQATGAGAHLSHIGNFRVFARVLTPTANTGAVSIALNWGEGDFVNASVNEPVDFPVDAWDNSFRLVDLGQVHLSKVAAGTQRWEGRFIAKSTVSGDKIRIDHFFLVPIDEGSGEVSAVVRPQPPAAFTARDSYASTTSGNALNARVAPIGGTWATSGDATDFLFSDDTTDGTHPEPLKRTTAVAGTTGRFAILGTATPTAVSVETAIYVPDLSGMTVGTNITQGVVARWTDASNFASAFLSRSYLAGTPFPTIDRRLILRQRIAGANTDLAISVPILASGSSQLWFVVQLTISADGLATALIYNADKSQRIYSVSASSSALATGGTLASGKSGLVDFSSTTVSQIRNYSAFSVYAPVPDAAIFASQSLELRSDRVVREDSGGTLWQRPSSYEGDYPMFPPAGKEARSVRTIVKACRTDPRTGADVAIDDLSYRATVTPRYLVLPS